MTRLATLDSVSDRPRPVLADISVVIPTLGRPVLETALAELASGTHWPARIVVVDQGRRPEVAGWLERLGAHGLATRYLPSDARGRSAGVNRGLSTVETAYVAVTDDDCFVEPEWLARMRAALEANPGGIVSGRVEAAGDEEVVALVTGTVPSIQRRPSLRFDTMSGGNMGTSRTVLDRVGPFDEDPRLATAEDCDWAYRALRAGVPIVYAPDVCLRHYGWRDPGERDDQYRSYARSHGGFYGKHLRRGDMFIAMRAAAHLGRAFRRWLRGSLRGDREQVAHGRAYLTGLPRGILSSLRRSH